MYEGKTIDETLKKLSADGERGLREEDVKERQKHYGSNELEEKKAENASETVCRAALRLSYFRAVCSGRDFRASGGVQRRSDYHDCGSCKRHCGGSAGGKSAEGSGFLKAMTRLKASVVRDGREIEIERQGAWFQATWRF